MNADVLRNPELGAHRRALPGSVPGARSQATVTADRAADAAASATREAEERQRAEQVRRAADEARVAAERAVEARLQRIAAEAAMAEQRRAAEHAERLSALACLLGKADELRRLTLEALEQEAIALAYAALCRIAGPQPDAGALLAGLVRRAFVQRGERPVIAVRMHPLDLAMLWAHPEGKTLLEAGRGVRWQEDPALPRAGCVMALDVGELDASLDVQLAALRDLWCTHRATPADDVGPGAGNA